MGVMEGDFTCAEQDFDEFLASIGLGDTTTPAPAAALPAVPAVPTVPGVPTVTAVPIRGRHDLHDNCAWRCAYVAMIGNSRDRWRALEDVPKHTSQDILDMSPSS